MQKPFFHTSLTLAKNLISCSWGDFSTRPLLTTASAKHFALYSSSTSTLCCTTLSVLSSLSHNTKMSNELLCNFHPFQQLLKETVGKPLLNGRYVRFHVFEAPKVSQQFKS